MANGENTRPKIDRFRGVPKKIADEISVYETLYFKEDLPVPFCGELKLYPALVHDFEDFSSCSICLTLNKNTDPKGIRMSQLEYLYTRTQLPGNEGKDWSYRVQRLFEIIFHIQNGIKCVKCGRVLAYTSPEFKEFISQIHEAQAHGKAMPELQCPEDGCDSKQFIEMMKFIEDPETKTHVLSVNGQIIGKEDYDRLRYIVLYQNFPDYRDDSWVDPDLKRDYEERQRLERAQNDVYATLEKKIVCLSCTTSFSFEQIYNMSIRKFSMALATVDDLINYKILKTAAMSGFVSWPKDKPIEHWIYKPLKDLYGDVTYKSLDSVKSV